MFTVGFMMAAVSVWDLCAWTMASMRADVWDAQNQKTKNLKSFPTKTNWTMAKAMGHWKALTVIFKLNRCWYCHHLNIVTNKCAVW